VLYFEEINLFFDSFIESEKGFSSLKLYRNIVFTQFIIVIGFPM